MAIRPIRIFVDAHVFDGEYQGTRSFIQEMYRRLAAESGRFTLYLGAHDTENLARIFPTVPKDHLIRYRSTNRIVRLGWELPILLNKLKPDFAHFQYMAPWVKMCPYIITTHDILFWDTPQYFSLGYKIQKTIFFYMSLLQADIRTTVSEFSRQSIAHHFKIPKESIHVIANGVSNRYFESYDKASVAKQVKEKFHLQKYILYVSRYEPRKNHAGLLQAVRKGGWLQKGYSLVFVGHKSIEVPELLTEINALSNAEKAYFYQLENVSDAELLLLIQAASLFVYPSLSEGFGIPPLEAAALQIPTVCSNQTAMADFGFFGAGHVNPHETGALQKAIELYVTQPPNEAQLKAISQTIKQKYNWQEQANTLMNLIEEKAKVKKAL